VRRPYTVIVSEVSIDGKLTLAKGVSSKILMSLMDEEANKYLHQIRADFDGIMVGANTVRTDNPNLTVRYVEGENPTRIIPTVSGEIPENSNILNTSVAPTIIAVCEKTPKEKVRMFESKGARVIVSGEEKINFPELFEKLYALGIEKLIVEGGSSLNWEILNNDLVDEIRLIHLPVVVGGEDVPTLAGGEGAKVLEKIKKFKIKNVFVLGNQVITEYVRLTE